MAVDLDELERLARAATPGPWTWDNAKGNEAFHLEGAADNYDDREILHAISGTIYSEHSSDPACIGVAEKHKAYISAVNPTVILELIERVRRAEAR